MRHRRRVLACTLLAALALSVTAMTAPAAAAPYPAANPPPLPAVESLITEGATIEGPLVNSVALSHLL